VSTPLVQRVITDKEPLRERRYPFRERRMSVRSYRAVRCEGGHGCDQSMSACTIHPFTNTAKSFEQMKLVMSLPQRDGSAAVRKPPDVRME
jgi:hypothetical protein